MQLSMDLEEHNLVLDLGTFMAAQCYWFVLLTDISCVAGEILEGKTDGCQQQDGPLRTVLETLRVIGQHSLSLREKTSNFHVQTTLRRILKLYSKPAFRETFEVDDELLRWMEHQDGETELSGDRQELLELVNFLAEEADPADVLKTLARSKLVESSRQELLPILRSVLSRGASAGSELSAALLYIKMARQRLGRAPATVSDSHFSVASDDSGGGSIWQGMASGVVSMEK